VKFDPPNEATLEALRLWKERARGGCVGGRSGDHIFAIIYWKLSLLLLFFRLRLLQIFNDRVFQSASSPVLCL
jgi:hypothetical protein